MALDPGGRETAYPTHTPNLLSRPPRPDRPVHHLRPHHLGHLAGSTWLGDDRGQARLSRQRWMTQCDPPPPPKSSVDSDWPAIGRNPPALATPHRATIPYQPLRSRQAALLSTPSTHIRRAYHLRPPPPPPLRSTAISAALLVDRPIPYLNGIGQPACSAARTDLSFGTPPFRGVEGARAVTGPIYQLARTTPRTDRSPTRRHQPNQTDHSPTLLVRVEAVDACGDSCLEMPAHSHPHSHPNITALTSITASASATTLRRIVSGSPSRDEGLTPPPKSNPILSTPCRTLRGRNRLSAGYVASAPGIGAVGDHHPNRLRERRSRRTSTPLRSMRTR